MDTKVSFFVFDPGDVAMYPDPSVDLEAVKGPSVSCHMCSVRCAQGVPEVETQYIQSAIAFAQSGKGCSGVHTCRQPARLPEELTVFTGVGGFHNGFLSGSAAREAIIELSDLIVPAESAVPHH